MRFLLPFLFLFVEVIAAQTPLRSRIMVEPDAAAPARRNLEQPAADGGWQLQRANRKGVWQTSAVAVPLPALEPFTAFTLFYHLEGMDPERLQLYLSTSTDGRRWTGFRLLEKDPDFTPESGERYKCALQMLEPDIRYVRIRVQLERRTPGLLRQLELNFFTPGPGSSDAGRPVREAAETCDCPQPAFLDRSQWCTIGNCDPVSQSGLTTVTHLIVHHSAGSNNNNNWNAVVTAIWNDHVFNNGWSDIGYNWLVAPSGTLYQGRGDNRIGAHFCQANTGTMGVCMMGTYTTSTPTQAALDTLAGILAWKACQRNLDPLGSAFHAASNQTLDRISGHRDGCATECPGSVLYNLLPVVRANIQDRLANCATASLPSLANTAYWLKVYPNPVQEELTIETAPDNLLRSVVLLDASGRAVLEQTGLQQHLLRLRLPENLPQGACFLSVWSDRGVQTVGLSRQ